MLRKVLGALVGIFAFALIGTAGFFLLRVSWHDYALAEPDWHFTLPMLLARLALGVVCCVAAGWVAAMVAKGDQMTSWWLGVFMLAIFIPMHYGLWDKFPLWYHLAFLLSLAPMIGLGGLLARRTS
jgi:hypothetical protein